jgi:hypothetical protein
MIDAAIAAGVQEITRAEYIAARPVVEELI